jgi:predicted DNA-binding protein
MSPELRDFRGRISVETDAVLEAISRATGREKQEIVRDVLHKWAEEQIRISTLTLRMLRSKGSEGSAGE